MEHNIFKKIGSLKFLECCNYTVSKLPIKLSMFHQQALLSWKLSFVHNFSPHKEILWNNANITIRNKSIYKDEWIERNICFVADLFNDNGNIYSYEDFMRLKHFPIKYKEFKSVVNAIPAGMVQLFKSHLAYRTTIDVQLPTLTVGGKDITHKTCTNKHIRSIVQGQSKFSPRGKFYWDSQFNGISWCKAWLNPFQFCISNKIKEVHFKILHTIYPTNKLISKFADVDPNCTFCGYVIESVIHLFCDCSTSLTFWKDLERFVQDHSECSVTITPN